MGLKPSEINQGYDIAGKKALALLEGKIIIIINISLYHYKNKHKKLIRMIYLIYILCILQNQ